MIDENTTNAAGAGLTTGLATGNPYAAGAVAGLSLIGGLMSQRAKAKAEKRKMIYEGAQQQASLQLQQGQQQQQGLEGIIAALRSSFIF